MAVEKPLPPLPSFREGLIDGEGNMTPVWYKWFRNLEETVRTLQTTVDDHETRITALEPP